MTFSGLVGVVYGDTLDNEEVAQRIAHTRIVVHVKDGEYEVVKNSFGPCSITDMAMELVKAVAK